MSGDKKKKSKEEQKTDKILSKIDINKKIRFIIPEGTNFCVSMPKFEEFEKIKEKIRLITEETYGERDNSVFDNASRNSNIELSTNLNIFEDRDLQKVDYDMDSFDLKFLEKLKPLHIPFDIFELIIDRIEKEHYIKCQERIKNVQKEEDLQSLTCNICSYSNSTSNNELIYCDGCNICVHQECYGVSVLSEFWLCRICLLHGTEPPKCEFCTKIGGAYKKTKNHKWGHILCTLYIPELSFLNLVFLEPIDFDDNFKTEKKIKCTLCDRTRGLLLKCSVFECKNRYHVACGIDDDLYFDHSNFISYCKVHDPRKNVKFFGIEDFYGFHTLSYPKLNKIPIVRNYVKLHQPKITPYVNIKYKIPSFDREIYDRILKIDLENVDLDKENILDVVYNYWIKKRSFNNKPLVDGLDLFLSNVNYRKWNELRTKKFLN